MVLDVAAIKKDEFKDTPNIVAAMKHAKENNGRLHLMGLVCASRSALIIVLSSHVYPS
jgi:bisphosphoglycerate-independent phosphoglycerate mutase (AlkP superfamily)